MRRAALVLALLWAGAAAGQSPELIQSVRESTVKIGVTFADPSNPANLCPTSSEGSGVIISDDGYVLSVAHTFIAPRECADAGFTDVRATARIGYANTGDTQPLGFVAFGEQVTDVSIWKLGERAQPYPTLPVCNERHLSTGAALTGFGFPIGNDFSALATTYQNSGGPLSRWVVSSDFIYGFSGGPVLNGTGEVVGIIQGGAQNAAAVRYVIPIRHAAGIIAYAGGDALRNCGAGTGGWSQSDAMAQIQAQSACIAMLPAEISAGVTGVRRTCGGETCEQICATLDARTTQDQVRSTRNYTLLGGLHVYPLPPSTTDGQVGLLTYVYNLGSPHLNRNYCGPNYCCCAADY